MAAFRGWMGRTRHSLFFPRLLPAGERAPFLGVSNPLQIERGRLKPLGRNVFQRMGMLSEIAPEIFGRFNDYIQDGPAIPVEKELGVLVDIFGFLDVMVQSDVVGQNSVDAVVVQALNVAQGNSENANKAKP